MKKTIMLLILAMTLQLGTGMAGAEECNKDTIEQKARVIAQRMERLQQTNMGEYDRIMLRFNNKASLLDPDDLQAWCDLYDQMLFEI